MTLSKNDFLNNAANTLTMLVGFIHARNTEAGWWTDLTYETKMNLLIEKFGCGAAKEIAETLGMSSSLRGKVIPEKLCLTHSELSEAMEGHRKGLMDDKLPHHSMLAVELADAVIRIFDLAGSEGINLGHIIVEKLEYNNTRPDHKIENRLKDSGKKY